MSLASETVEALKDVRSILHEAGWDSAPRIQPLGDYLTVERDPLPNQTPSGLILPALHSRRKQERLTRATVTAVGPGRMCTDGRRRQMQMAVGDRVLITHYAGQDLAISRDTELPLLREDDCLAVLKPLYGLVTLRTGKRVPLLSPVNQRVLVRFDRFAEEYGSGIVAQTERDERVQVGTVLAVGPGFPIRSNILPAPMAFHKEHLAALAEPSEEHGYAPLHVRPGDIVCWEHWAKYEFKLREADEALGLGPGTYRLIRAEDLIGQLEE